MRRKKSNTTRTLLILLAVVALATVALAVSAVYLTGGLEPAATDPPTEPTASPTVPAETAAAETETEAQTLAPELGIQYPYSFADDRLVLASLATLTGQNPDCDNDEGTDIAMIIVENVFSAHLAQASIQLTLSDGQTLKFFLADVPAGKTVMAFSLENASVGADVSVTDVMCDYLFEEETPLQADKVSVSVDGTTVTVKNLTDEELSGLTVCCHALLDGDYYGGLTYEYTLGTLPAGGSATVEAVDCYIDGAEVVRIGS